MSQNQQVTRAIGLMIPAMLMLPGIDAIAKWLSGSISAGQVTWCRFLFQTLFLLPFILQAGRLRVPSSLWLHAARGALLVAATLFFFSGLVYLPLADAISIFFVEPLMVTILSAIFLKETFGWRRLVAIVIGFIGALIIIRPTFAEIGWAAMYPVFAAVCFSFYILLTRKLVAREDPIQLQFYAGMFGLAVCSALLIGTSGLEIRSLAVVQPTLSEWGLLCGLGLIGTVGHLLVVHAFKHAPVSVLAPFQYVEIIGSTILGLLLFGDFPDGATWVGILIIVSSGIYVFHREAIMNASEAQVGNSPSIRQ
ncbi:MAG: DMT family transporter [Gammaproteobacteria bacterium]|nr:DMT family transporter [Gammaproteobacteria bacterium]